MNRAERRRQKKMASKAAANKTPAPPPNHSPTQQSLATQQALNLALQHHNAGRLSEAETLYQQILQADPNHSDALHLRGVIAINMGKIDLAVDLITKALTINPNFALAHANLGVALGALGEFDDAIACYRKAISINPNLAMAHSGLGAALSTQGRFDEAIVSYHRAIAIDPDFAEAHGNLGIMLIEQEKEEEAFSSLLRATALRPQDDTFWVGLAKAVETLSFTLVDDDLLHVLMQLLTHPSVEPGKIVTPIIRALRCYPDFSQILEQTCSEKAETELSYAKMARQLSDIPLFLRVMGLSPIADLQIERMLTVLRRLMAREAAAGKADEQSMPFSAAIALQCFINEYVFSETEEEMAIVENICQRIETGNEMGQDAPPFLLATLGAYRPLHRFPWAQKLSEYGWESDIKDVIVRQISEPQTEQALRHKIPRLTPIQDAVSQSVREQYEENPYPRWIRTGVSAQGRKIDSFLRGGMLRLDLGDYVAPESPEILVAGCGTGKQVLNTVDRFSNARVLAVDLSLSSLSYAARKTKELKLTNIEYAQGDILKLGNLGRQFDIIECGGVLHHLSDPLAGWKVMVDLLRPGGIMMIALYSETARQDVIKGRSLIAQRGYIASPRDIRRCREDIIAMAEDGNAEMSRILSFADFFSLSSCRDLLFHVQEHRFTLPQIEAALTSLKLEFLGFEIGDSAVLNQFRASHPNKVALTSLQLWHEFELKNPNTFRGMYKFWCKKNS